MNAAIITIGNEILDGSRLDTNSQWIAEKITHYGIVIDKIISVGDNVDSICSIVKKTIDKYNFIFITGGLGPTHDDITISSFQKVFNLESSIDYEYQKILEQRFLDRNVKMPKINNNQALILKDTTILDNSIGTARGIYYKFSKSKFFIMPGVPDEMCMMMEKIIVPLYLGDKIENLQRRSIRTSGISESKLAEKLDKLIKYYSGDFSFSFLPSYQGVDFIIKSICSNKDINKVAADFYNKMNPYAFGYNKDSFLQFMIRELDKKDLSISTAESCTGGLLGKMLTDVSGSSKVFYGGIIAYSNLIKLNQIKVSKEKLDKYGAVSLEVAEEMAKNIKKIFKSDVGISITGISGPSGDSLNKNIGLVYIGIAYKNECVCKQFNFNLTRDLNRKISCYTALNMMRKIIND